MGVLNCPITDDIGRFTLAGDDNAPSAGTERADHGNPYISDKRCGESKMLYACTVMC